MIIGILALQGGYVEHQKKLIDLHVNTLLVKTVEDLENIDGIILPGGESTTIGNLLKKTGLMQPLKQKIEAGLPTYGTCAGLILLAKKIEEEDGYLQVMDIVVKRNAYGRQLASFKVEQVIPEISKYSLPLVFIRAPWIESSSEKVEVLLKLDGKIVCAKQNNILVSSFHPELTNNNEVHKYFLNMIKKPD